MIIKSTARKTPSFSQLINYFHKGETDRHYRIYRGFHAFDEEYIKTRFFDNSRLVKKRKKGNYIYHEILSIKKVEGLTYEEHAARLKDIAEQYIEARTNGNLVYAVLHYGENDDLHYHIMFSANQTGSSKKTRISKAKLDEIKKRTLRWARQKYPELKLKDCMERKNTGKKLSTGAQELKRRTGRTPQRDSVISRLDTVFSGAGDKEEFFKLLQQNKLEIYVRGKAIGVIDLQTGRKHRLRTLGVLEKFQAVSHRIELEQVGNGRGREEAQKQYREAQGSKEHIHPPNPEMQGKQKGQRGQERQEKQEVPAQKTKQHPPEETRHNSPSNKPPVDDKIKAKPKVQEDKKERYRRYKAQMDELRENRKQRRQEHKKLKNHK